MAAPGCLYSWCGSVVKMLHTYCRYDLLISLLILSIARRVWVSSKFTCALTKWPTTTWLTQTIKPEQTDFTMRGWWWWHSFRAIYRLIGWKWCRSQPFYSCKALLLIWTNISWALSVILLKVHQKLGRTAIDCSYLNTHTSESFVLLFQKLSYGEATL